MAIDKDHGSPGSAAAFPEGPTTGKRLHGTIAQRIGIDIVAGVFRPGEILPNEDSFSETLGVSRSAYREAIRILAAKGLVESRPKVGTRINDRARWHMLDADILSWQFETNPSETFLAGLFELRLVLEPAAAAMAARRRSEANVTAMRAALVSLRDFGIASERGYEADMAFHRELLRATGNEPFMALTSTVLAAIGWAIRVVQSRYPHKLRDSIDDHDRILEAIAQRDPVRAADLTRVLAEVARDDALRVFQEQSQSRRPCNRADTSTT